MSKIGIIGGSGVEELTFIKGFKNRVISTEYGGVLVREGKAAGKDIVFLIRHGKEYLLPSEVNYRANVAALKKTGVKAIITTAAVGAINRKMRPGDFAVLSDFIDFTRGKRETFTARSFIDMSEPYNVALNKKIAAAAKLLGLKVHQNAVYACAEGPRFETRAEIKMYGKMGADLVGMTQVPEVVLAAEAGIPYATIAVVTNYAAGVSPQKIDAKHVVAMMRKKTRSLAELIYEVIREL